MTEALPGGAVLVPAVQVVLASASPRRADLLRRIGITAAIRPADVDETPGPGEPAHDLVRRLAAAKARAIAVDTDDVVVVAADTVVVAGEGDDEVILGKPVDRADAARMLARLRGATHAVITGVAVVRGVRSAVEAVRTEVTFRDLTDAEIATYVASGEPDDKAGAYAIQGAGGAFVRAISGSESNVVGLPLAELVALFAEVGVTVQVAAS